MRVFIKFMIKFSNNENVKYLLTILQIKKIVKSKVYVNNINFFDFILQINMSKLYLTISNISFLLKLKNSTIKYQKQNIFDVLHKCFQNLVYK